MKKVLIIAYSFPPNPAVSSLRIRGMVKYLPEFGWEPIVLTPAMPERSNSIFNVKLVETPYHDVLASWRKRLGLNPDRAVQIQRELDTAGSNNSSNNTFKLINRFIKLSKHFFNQ